MSRMVAVPVSCLLVVGLVIAVLAPATHAMHREYDRSPLFLQKQSDPALGIGSGDRVGSVIVMLSNDHEQLEVIINTEPAPRQILGNVFVGVFTNGVGDTTAPEKSISGDDFKVVGSLYAGEQHRSLTKHTIRLPNRTDRDGNGFLEAMVILREQKMGLMDKGGVSSRVLRIPLP